MEAMYYAAMDFWTIFSIIVFGILACECYIGINDEIYEEYGDRFAVVDNIKEWIVEAFKW